MGKGDFKSTEKKGGPTWPSKLYTKEDLQPYKRFRDLYLERKYAQEYPKQTQTLSFTGDVPAEIRLMIYEHIGIHVSGRFFELCDPPFPTPTSEDKQDAADTRPIQNSFTEYAKFREALRLMRLCKKVHNEIAGMFYSQQNFRFSAANGFPMLCAWMYTIKPNSFEYLRHITVQIAVRDQSSDCTRPLVHWSHFEGIQKKRGMRVPRSGGEDKAIKRPSPHDQHCYGRAVSRAFEYLKWIPRLRSLEFTVPSQYGFIAWSGIEPHCSARYLELLSPSERVRHVVEDHCKEDFWKSLKELKQQSASEELRIAFVMIHDTITLDAAADDYLYQGRMRAARWLAAYAEIQGYGFGHARWAEGTYCVEYDEDALLALPHKWDETDEAAKLREPPENIVQQSEQLEEEHCNASAEECSSFSTWQ